MSTNKIPDRIGPEASITESGSPYITYCHHADDLFDGLRGMENTITKAAGTGSVVVWRQTPVIEKTDGGWEFRYRFVTE